MLPPPTELPIKIRRHATARRIVMRLSPCGQEVRLTIPKRLSEKKALAFVEEQRAWLDSQRARSHDSISFAPGIIIPLFGESVTLAHNPAQRGSRYEAQTLTIGGDTAHFPRRVEDWIRKQAKHRFAEQAMAIAEPIGEHPAAISVRDTSSRWGSCSRSRRISLNWRLAFAPAETAYYVIAHEVAHMVHFDHSPEFWALVGQLDPNWRTAKTWLRQHGNTLHRYGK